MIFTKFARNRLCKIDKREGVWYNVKKVGGGVDVLDAHEFGRAFGCITVEVDVLDDPCRREQRS